MFNYEFMRVAMVVGVLLAFVIPMLGTTVVYKRLSMTGDALSHTSLAGVALGLICGFNPMIVAVITCVIASIVIEIIRKKFYKYSELAIAIVLSTGIGLAGILSSFTPAANFNAYLFGSIVAISKLELWLTVGLFILVFAFNLVFYKEIMYISFNESSAKIAKIPVRTLNFCHTILTAITVAISSKIIGALIVSSLMVVPVATSMQVSKTYKQTLIFSILFAILSVVLGLTLSFYLNLKPGGTIVILNIIFLAVAIITKYFIHKHNAKHKHNHESCESLEQKDSAVTK